MTGLENPLPRPDVAAIRTLAQSRFGSIQGPGVPAAMGQPAARIGDMHTCPMVTVLVPHVGGPIAGPCAPTVLIGGMPAARVSDMCVCVGPPDVIAKGSATVLIMGMPAARMGDMTVHGGVIVVGMPTVLIGDAGGGGAVTLDAAGPMVAPTPEGKSGGAGAAGAAGAGKTGEPTGLGDKVDALAAKSPTLQKNLKALKDAGWTIRYTKEGDTKGSYADRSKKLIVIDERKKDDAKSVVRSLAHESGHAMYKKPPAVWRDGMSKEDYAKENTQINLKDEGEATLTNAQIRNEIKDADGTDIGISGKEAAEYEKIAKKYPDPKDRDQAREEIANVFAEKEKPSNDDTVKNYREYYSRGHEKAYDKANPPKKK